MILFNVISISYIENDVLFFYLELLHKDFFKSDPRAKKNKIKKKRSTRRKKEFDSALDSAFAEINAWK